MPKKLNYQLSESELEEIEEAQRTAPDPRVRQRATGLRLLHMSKQPAEVAELLNVSQATVFNWHREWRAEGLDGLADKPRSGRPPLADAAYRARVEELIETDPTTLGYGFTCWTVPRLIARLEQETGIHLSINTMRNVLKALNYVSRRPKHELNALQDAEAKERAKELLDELKKTRKPARSNFSLWTKQP